MKSIVQPDSLRRLDTNVTQNEKTNTIGLPVVVLSVLLIAGCNAEQGQKPAAEQTTDTATVVEVTDEMSSILAKADAVDGTTDKIVANCPVCLLGMAGSNEHELAVGDYTLRFCSDHCKHSFAEDVTKSVLEIEIPTDSQESSP